MVDKREIRGHDHKKQKIKCICHIMFCNYPKMLSFVRGKWIFCFFCLTRKLKMQFCFWNTSIRDRRQSFEIAIECVRHGRESLNGVFERRQLKSSGSKGTMIVKAEGAIADSLQRERLQIRRPGSKVRLNSVSWQIISFRWTQICN